VDRVPDARLEIEHLAEDGDTMVCDGTMSGIGTPGVSAS